MSLLFFTPVLCLCHITYTVRCDLYVHGPLRTLSRILTRDRLLILLFWLILHICLIRCISPTPFASVSFSQRYISRIHILLETISSVYIFSLSRSHAFQWFPTGLSFYFMLLALSSSIYLLLTKHVGIIPYRSLQYLSFIHFCRLTALHVRRIPRKFCPLQISPYICILFFSSSPLRYLPDLIFIRSCVFCLKLFRCSICFFILTNFILTKHPLIPFCTYQGSFLYSFTSLDLVVSSPYFLFFSLEPSLLYLIVLLVSFRSRFVHQRFPSPFAPLFPYFSNLPEIVFFLGRDRLYHRFPFSGRFSFRSRTVYFVASSLKMLVRFNFLGTLLFPVFTCFTPNRVLPASILHFCSLALF